MSIPEKPEQMIETPASQASLVSKATGPRTPQGKERSKYNAIKHGIFSKLVVLENEVPWEYKSLRDELVEHFQPQTAIEELLVEKLAVFVWRHRRLIAAEAVQIKANTRFLSELGANWLDRMLRYEASLERAFDRALNQLERQQRMRLGQPVPPSLKVELSG